MSPMSTTNFATNKQPRRELFADLLRKSVIDAMDDVLGKQISKRLLLYLRLDTLEYMLEIGPLVRSTCGETASAIVERAIVKELSTRAGVNYKEAFRTDFDTRIEDVYEQFLECRA